MKHLLLISLGPVQDFIHSARRCQDLWFGSWLLSDLSQTTGTALLTTQAETQVIFPAGIGRHLEEGRPSAGVANIILASLQDGVSPRSAAEMALNAMRNRLNTIVSAAFQEIQSDPAFLGDVADKQLNELMETAWVAVPLGDNFRESRSRAYAKLLSVKNTQIWSQPGWNPQPGVPKDSLSGAREAVVNRRKAPSRTPEVWRSRFGLKKGEQLCGVSLLKRLGVALDANDKQIWGARGRPGFHSTSHSAALPVLHRLMSTESLQAHARNYIRTLEDADLHTDRFTVSLQDGQPTLCGLDGVLLFESRLEEHFDEACTLTGPQRDAALTSAKSALQLLRREARIGTQGPTPYFAFLIADGDRMGRAIDGIPTINGQVALGAALTSFANQCRDIITEHDGSLIFAGGDDVVAILPLDKATRCARQLADQFKRLTQPVVNAHWTATPGSDEEVPQTTLSAGIAVVHHMEDMGIARKIAGRAEALAKKVRNSLAVITAMRSGGERSVAGQWDEVVPLDSRLEEWVSLIRVGAISARTAHDLEDIAEHFAPLSLSEQRNRLAEMNSLVRYTLQRKRASGGHKIDDGALQTLVDVLAWTGTSADEQQSPSSQLRRVSAELQLARLLARADLDRNKRSPDLTEESP